METRHMSNVKIGQRGTCPVCFGPVIRRVDGEEPGKRQEWTVCGGLCGKMFYPPWPEHQWEDASTRLIPPELAVVLDEVPPDPRRDEWNERLAA